MSGFGRTSEGGFNLRFFFFFAVWEFESRWGILPAASWEFSPSSRVFLSVDPGIRDEGGVAGGRGTIFLRFRGGPMRTGALPGPAFDAEDKWGILSGSSSSSSSCIAFLLLRLESLMDFTREFREVDEDVPSILSFLVNGLGPSSTEACLVPRRFRFTRDGSSATREALVDVRDNTGESAARLLDTNEFRELLELRLGGLLGVGVVDTRGLFCFLEAEATFNILPKQERSKAHLDGYLSPWWPSLLPKLQRDPQLPLPS